MFCDLVLIDFDVCWFVLELICIAMILFIVCSCFIGFDYFD